MEEILIGDASFGGGMGVFINDTPSFSYRQFGFLWNCPTILVFSCGIIPLLTGNWLVGCFVIIFSASFFFAFSVTVDLMEEYVGCCSLRVHSNPLVCFLLPFWVGMQLLSLRMHLSCSIYFLNCCLSVILWLCSTEPFLLSFSLTSLLLLSNCRFLSTRSVSCFSRSVKKSSRSLPLSFVNDNLWLMIWWVLCVLDCWGGRDW